MSESQIRNIKINLKDIKSKSESDLEREIEQDKSKIKIREIPSNVKILSDKVSESKLETEVEPSSDIMETSNSGDFSANILSSGEIQELPRDVSQTALLEEDKKLFSENIRYSTPRQEFLSSQASQESSTKEARQYAASVRSAQNFNPSIVSSNNDFNHGERDINFGSSDELRALRNQKEEGGYRSVEFKAEKAKNRLPWEV